MIKRFGILNFVLMLIFLAGCRPYYEVVEPTISMKGVELYSWQTEEGEWFYSLMPGTNREKMLEEIMGVPMDQAALETAIEGLATGDSVLWSNWLEEDNWDALTFPSDDVIAGIVAYAAEVGVDIMVFKP